jgi:hypothetical protein
MLINTAITSTYLYFSVVLVTDEYQQMQHNQLKQHQKKKRAYTELLDNAGPAPTSSRRRL